MFRHLKFALVAALALAPVATPAQNDGLAALDAMIEEDGAESWAICTLASAHMNDIATSDAERAFRDAESRMLIAVAVARFMEQRGLGFTAAVDELEAIVTARAPVYEDGSGGDLMDMGTCIIAGMVSQTGEEQSERLVAAYGAVPPDVREAFSGAAPPPAPVQAAAPAAPPPAQSALAEMDFSAALGAGENFGAVSYRIDADGTLSGFYGFKAAGVNFTETAVPRVKGRGLAGTYDTSGTGSSGPYTGTLDLIEQFKLEGGVVTVYRIVMTIGTNGIAGTGLYIGGNSLSAVFGAEDVGRFHLGEDGAGWDLFLVDDAGGTARMGSFRFEGAHFEGSHGVLADGVRLGTATFTRDAAGVVRIAMPDGRSVVAVCAPEGAQSC
jgi:hypothetical protein